MSWCSAQSTFITYVLSLLEQHHSVTSAPSQVRNTNERLDFFFIENRANVEKCFHRKSSCCSQTFLLPARLYSRFIKDDSVSYCQAEMSRCTLTQHEFSSRDAILAQRSAFIHKRRHYKRCGRPILHPDERLISRGIMENEVCDFRLRDVLLELTDGLDVTARINFWDLL